MICLICIFISSYSTAFNARNPLKIVKWGPCILLLMNFSPPIWSVTIKSKNTLKFKMWEKQSRSNLKSKANEATTWGLIQILSLKFKIFQKAIIVTIIVICYNKLLSKIFNLMPTGGLAEYLNLNIFQNFINLFIYYNNYLLQ